jgi:hypothetical protein
MNNLTMSPKAAAFTAETQRKLGNNLSQSRLNSGVADGSAQKV